MNSNLHLFKLGILSQLELMSESCNENYDYYNWLENKRTIKLQLPRQCGSTTLAIELQKELPKSVIFTFSPYIACQLKRLNIPVIDTSNLYREICGCNFETFIYDCPKLFKPEFFKNIEEFQFNVNLKIIQLGQI